MSPLFVRGRLALDILYEPGGAPALYHSTRTHLCSFRTMFTGKKIFVSTAIYSILTRLILRRMTQAVALGWLNIQHSVLRGRDTTTLATKLLNGLYTRGSSCPPRRGQGFPVCPQTHAHRHN